MNQLNQYKQRIFKRKVLNIENTTRCTLLCSQCKRTTFLELNGSKFPGKDLTPEQFRKVVTYFDDITFGGQLSDPIFGTHFIEMLKICREHEIGPRVLTAATGKKESFYREAFEANPYARWTFGIDGPPELSHNYRKNQDGEFLFEMMKLAKKMCKRSTWQYIIFPWNEDYLEKCKEIAVDLGVKMEIIISERD